MPLPPCKKCIRCEENLATCKDAASPLGTTGVVLGVTSAVSVGVAIIPSPATPFLAACGAVTRTGAAVFGAAYYFVNSSCGSAYTKCLKDCIESQVCSSP